MAKKDIVERKSELNLHYLRNGRILNRFCEEVLKKLAFTSPSIVPTTESYRLLTNALLDSAQNLLPVKNAQANKPWISELPLNYINLRDDTSRNGDIA